MRSSSRGIDASICRGGSRFGLGDLREQLFDVLLAERQAAGDELVEHDAQAEHVGAAVDAVAFAAGLLGAHVRRRAGARRALRPNSSSRIARPKSAT